MQAVSNDTDALRDPRGFAHNGRYVLQLLYDSLDGLAQSGNASVNMTGKVPRTIVGGEAAPRFALIRPTDLDRAHTENRD